MDKIFLRYVHEKHRLHWKPLWEWLLEEANRMGVAGGSAFRAMAGFGQHRVLHEDRFFELQGRSRSRSNSSSPRTRRSACSSGCRTRRCACATR